MISLRRKADVLRKMLLINGKEFKRVALLSEMIETEDWKNRTADCLVLDINTDTFKFHGIVDSTDNTLYIKTFEYGSKEQK